MSAPALTFFTRLQRLSATAALALGLAMPALAETDAHAQLEDMARQWVDQNLGASENTAAMLRPEIEVGALDTRLRLAPCQQVEPYLPRGSRLWGRTRIGLR
jgi:flagellar basal body P-ring formation protein FlgA